MEARQYIDQVPEYEIRDGCMHIVMASGCLVMPLRTFEHGMAKARRALDSHYAAKADVVPLRQRDG